ncbi:hypothetical protein JCM10450v2_007264 [Rhodotorula kratochvilovae]
MHIQSFLLAAGLASAASASPLFKRNTTSPAAADALSTLDSQAAGIIAGGQNASSCFQTCQGFDNLLTVQCAPTNGTDQLTCMCDGFPLGTLLSCARCMEGNATAAASTFSSYCSDRGLGLDAITANPVSGAGRIGDTRQGALVGALGGVVLAGLAAVWA